MNSARKGFLPNLRKIPAGRKHLPQSRKRYPNHRYRDFIRTLPVYLRELVMQLNNSILLPVKPHTEHG